MKIIYLLVAKTTHFQIVPQSYFINLNVFNISRYPYDISNTPIYEITYFHQLFTLFIAALLHMTKDSLLTTVIAQCRCRLQLVSLALSNLCNDRHFTECDVSVLCFYCTEICVEITFRRKVFKRKRKVQICILAILGQKQKIDKY